MTRWAVTGPTKTNSAMDFVVEEFITHIVSPGDAVLSGCAEGVDTLVFEISRKIHGSEVKRVAVPPVGAYHNYALLDLADEILPVPPYPDHRRKATDAYRRRNEVLVENCDELAAFVWENTFYRSGEWMTIGICRDAGKPYTLHQASRIMR